MNAVLKLGRYLFAIPFAVFGVFHFMYADAMAGMVPLLPGGAIWVYLTGLAFILAAVSIIIQRHDKLACFLLGVMLLIFALSIHLPSGLESGDWTQFLKDTALAGGAWGYALMAAPEE